MIEQYRKEIEDYIKTPTDITEHLLTIFDECLKIKPKVIVELGIRGGDSTRVLERIATIFSSDFTSVDISPNCYQSSYNQWKYIVSDSANKLMVNKVFANKKIDVLFIDTSHLYMQTLNELEMYTPLMNKESVMIFHDTFSANTDSRVGQAIEFYFKLEHQDWSKDFTIDDERFLLKNYSNNNGMAFIWLK